jgi:transcriptional regulator with XRE-family HTH domain
MRQISQIIDDARESGAITSDNDLARKLGIHRASVSEWRHGKTAPSEDQAAALAALLNRPEILAEAMATRAKTQKGREVWEKAAMALSMSTIFMLLMTALPMKAIGDEAAQQDNDICIM